MYHVYCIYRFFFYFCSFLVLLQLLWLDMRHFVHLLWRPLEEVIRSEGENISMKISTCLAKKTISIFISILRFS